MADWPIRRDSSFLIGDRPGDLEAADNAGVPGLAYTGEEPLDVLVAHALTAAV